MEKASELVKCIAEIELYLLNSPRSPERDALMDALKWIKNAGYVLRQDLNEEDIVEIGKKNPEVLKGGLEKLFEKEPQTRLKVIPPGYYYNSPKP